MQAINELHEDDDFQQDAGQSRMLGIVDEIRTSASAMANHEKDAAVMHVLKKLRRFQVMPLDSQSFKMAPFTLVLMPCRCQIWKGRCVGACPKEAAPCLGALHWRE